MHRKILIAAATLILAFTLAPGPADASAFGDPGRPSLDLRDLVSQAASWLTGLWDASEEGRGVILDPDGEPTSSDPAPVDPEPEDDRGVILDPDG